MNFKGENINGRREFRRDIHTKCHVKIMSDRDLNKKTLCVCVNNTEELLVIFLVGL